MHKLKSHHQKFLKAVAEVSKTHGEAASEFALVKKADVNKAFTAGAAANAEPVCILWGFDPTTGLEICLKWSS